MNTIKNLYIKSLILLSFVLLNSSIQAQLLFSESFNQADHTTTGTDAIANVAWSTNCPTCVNNADFIKVLSGELVTQDSNGPAYWETDEIDISTTGFFNISLDLKEEGTMEGCGTGCSSVDWVQLEYNIDNTGWVTPSNSIYCSGPCANVNVIQSDDISGTLLNYTTGCIASGTNLKLRIVTQAWAASEQWIVDNIEVNSSVTPIVDAGIDQTACATDNITLTALNPENGIITWNNNITNNTPFTPIAGINTYIVSSDLNGCIGRDTVIVTINNPPTYTVTSTTPSNCDGTNGTILISELQPNTTYLLSYTESNSAVGPNTLTSDINGDILISNLTIGTYSDITVDLVGCSTTDATVIELTNNSIPIVHAGPDQTICEADNIQLTAINPNNATISWDNGIVDNMPFTAPVGTTIYTVTANLNGCLVTDEVSITIKPTPEVEVENDLTLCEGETATLTAININAAQISWNNGITDGISFTPNVGSLTYTVTADLNGCIATNQANIIVQPIPNFSIQQSNPIFCQGTDGLITLTGLDLSTNYSYSYNNGVAQGPFNITTNQFGEIDITNLPSGTYDNFQVVHQNCTAENDVTIQLTEPTLPIIDAGPDLDICIGDAITLTATNPNNAQLSWNNGVTDGIEFQPNDNLSYIVTSTLNNCINSDTVSINLFDPPLINAGDDQTICPGQDVLLNASSSHHTIEWSNNLTDSTHITPEITTTYIATATVGTCSVHDSITITVAPLPDATFQYNPNQPTVEHSEVEFHILNPEPDSESYVWDFGDSQFSNTNSPIHYFPEIGGITYHPTLTVTNNAGCKDSSSLSITIEDLVLYYIPNSFTPNDDHLNNTFQPVFTSGFDSKDYHLTIYNRWGEILFESFDSTIGWNGSFKNTTTVSSGVYVWAIEFGTLNTAKKHSITGHVTLIK